MVRCSMLWHYKAYLFEALVVLVGLAHVRVGPHQDVLRLVVREHEDLGYR